jgi:glutaredoxin
MTAVVIYGRPGCHLCEDAAAVAQRVQTRLGAGRFTVEQRDIDDDDELFKRYLERIPVVTIDGREAFELFLDEDGFERAVLAAPNLAAP